ncbi:MAG: DNA helicase UvrD [Nitrososphaeria archaeon]|nr:DNA helicase UvrD [Nitrososphaeria archaeon]NIN51723.1 DNA helicase UvrD [Nitrososphaeria archaeon]NIQ32217.1 DNA helicase UvrD [Nitrososphaeria archaeon]
MRIICDLHLHSKYSRATSQNMDIENLARYGKLKGLNLLGTGDFTHPLWLEELKSKLELVQDTGLYRYTDILFMLTAEVSTIYEQAGKVRKIHHIIHVPSFEAVDQINEKLEKHGSLYLDGRPTFNNLTSPELVEIVMECCDDSVVIPAHLWTPWFSCLGSKSGFDSVEECYQDQVKHIYAVETGLSSDPGMNFRLSALDKYTLVSNSDSHSPWPWRIGREANAFELDEVTFWKIFQAVKKKDRKRFLYTIEFFPEEGKYHYDGHRKCGVSMAPQDSMKLGGVCPRCGRMLTIGVLNRVEELADRPEGFIPEESIPYKSLVPLSEIISVARGVKTYSQALWKEYFKITEKLGDELYILLEAPEEELSKTLPERIAEGILRVRKSQIKFNPGHDGQYGEVLIYDEEVEQRFSRGLSKFM